MTEMKKLSTLRTLLLDPAYRKLWLKTRSWRTLVQAGFIAEPMLNRSYKLADDWFTRTHGKYAGQPGVILLMTGCFAPMHHGHIEAMNLAKRAIEKRLELPVLAGYLSLCHGDYVFAKTFDPILSLPERARDMENTLMREAPWLMPSTWEAKQTGPLNFTTVYRQFAKLFKDQRIVYVYGSDNEAFRLAFLNNELNVCVKRSGRVTGPLEVHPEIKTNTMFLGGGTWKAMSSTILRNAAKKNTVQPSSF